MARPKKKLATADIGSLPPTNSIEFDHSGALVPGQLAIEAPETLAAPVRRQFDTDEHYQAALQKFKTQGNWATPTLPNQVEDGDVDVVSPGGKLGSVPRAQLQSALESKYRIPTLEDYKRHELEKSLDNPAMKAAAFATGALGTFSLGASDAALAGVYGDEGRQALQGLATSDPTRGYHVGGQVAGMFIPGNPASLAGKGVSGLARAGGLAGAGSLLGRAAQRGLAGAVAGGTEMALFEAGSQISEDVLGDQEVTAEKLRHALGRGFFTGAPIGAAFGAGSALIEHAAPKFLAKVGTKADDVADTMRARQFGMRIGDARKLGKTAEEIAIEEQRMARIGEELGLSKARDFEELSNMTAAEKAKAGAAIGEGYKAADKGGALFDASNIYRKGEEVLDTLSTVRTQVEALADGSFREVTKRVPVAGLESDFNEVSKYLRSLENDLGGTAKFEAAWTRRQALDALLDGFYNRAKEAGGTSKGERALLDLRKTFEEELATQLEAKLGPLDQAALEGYKRGKELYGALSDIQNWSTREFARSESASNVRFRDYMGGGTGAYIGSRVGAMVAGAPGAAIGSGVGGVLGGMANRFANENASRHVADFARKASKLRVLGDRTAQLTKDVERGIQNFVDGTRSTVVKGTSSISQYRKRYHEIAEHIRYMANNPEAVAERVGKQIHPELRAVAPNVVTSMVVQAQQGYQFLNSVAPKTPTSGNYLQPTLGKPRLPNDGQLLKFFRYLDAMDQTPLKVLDLALKGKLHREAVHVLKETSPHMYEFMRQGIMDAVGKSRKRMTMQQKAALSIIYGIAVDSTQEREFVTFCQQAYNPQFVEEANQGANPPAESPNGATAQAPKRPLSGLEEDYRTAVDQLMV